MRSLLTLALGFCFMGQGSAMGFTEDPSEVITRTWTPGTIGTLEIRGEVEVEFKSGPVTTVTVTASRALFDQLTVSNWWGRATVAIETGLRGPREQGKVKVIVELASLKELSVSERSLVFGQWPSPEGTLRVADGSSAKLSVHASRFVLQAQWKSAVSLSGDIATLQVAARQDVQVDLRDCQVGLAEVELDQASSYLAGSTGQGRGRTRHGSRFELPVLADGLASPWVIVAGSP